jgi:hypothetical protein
MNNEMEELNYMNSLEKKLSESLRPVRPDPTFIHSLREKLARSSAVIVEKRGPNQGLLIVGIGLVTGIAFVWLMRRFKA